MSKDVEETKKTTKKTNTKLEDLFEGYSEESIESRYPDFDWGHNFGEEIIE